MKLDLITYFSALCRGELPVRNERFECVFDVSFWGFLGCFVVDAFMFTVYDRYTLRSFLIFFYSLFSNPFPPLSSQPSSDYNESV